MLYKWLDSDIKMYHKLWKILCILLLCGVVKYTDAVKECCKEAKLVPDNFECGGEEINLICDGQRTLMSKDFSTWIHYYSLDNESVRFTANPYYSENFCIQETEERGTLVVACVSVGTLFQYADILTFLSGVINLLVLLIYCWIPELRNIRGKCLMFHLAFTLVGLLTNVTCHFAGYGETNTFLIILGVFVTLYGYTGSLAWINTIVFDLWRTIKYGASEGMENILFTGYIIWGLGVPLFLTVCDMYWYLPMIYNMLFTGDDHGLTTRLMIRGSDAICSFINRLLLLWIIIIRIKCRCRKEKSPIRWMPFLTWLLCIELVNIFQYIVIIADTLKYGETLLHFLQSLITLFFTVIMRKPVIKGLVRHRVFCLSWPQRWLTLDDDESLVDENTCVENGEHQLTHEII